MGKALADMCYMLGCLPSELFQKHDPTIGDFLFVSAIRAVEQEEADEAERAGSTVGGKSSPSGHVTPHIPYKRGGRR